MSTATPYGYELRVDGHLDRHWRSRFGDLELTHHDDGTSTLAGPVADQSQLHGLLAGLRDIGATLLSVRPIDQPDPDKRSPPPAFHRLEWPARTERLTLRPAREDDAEPTWRFRRQESVGRWLTAVPHSLEDYRATFEEPDRLATTLIVERDGEVIGDLMLKIEDAWAQTEVAVRARGVQAELGWVLDPADTGHGFETEAVRELLRLCFDELDLRRVVARCFSDNEASWRLMERLGMRRELHAVRESLHRSGEWLDIYGYAMLACERHAKTDPQG
ncbi:MAG TPA: GNAT family N-acetyltransferase [Jiangellaceae bacterium]|nr:GNAT family N-acetyltransferase [Jiangellaceae bacterium]